MKDCEVQSILVLWHDFNTRSSTRRGLIQNLRLWGGDQFRARTYGFLYATLHLLRCVGTALTTDCVRSQRGVIEGLQGMSQHPLSTCTTGGCAT